VELGLVNAQDEPPANKDSAWLFQPRLTVTAADHAVFCPIDDPADDAGTLDADPEDKHLRLLYRDELRHAVGRNVATRAHVRDGERKAYRLETTWLPSYEVPATIALQDLGGAEFRMHALAEAPQAQLEDLLGPLAAGYERWLHDQEARIGTLPPALQETAEAAIFDARRCAARIRAGIDTLTSDSRAFTAFRFANRAMLLQRQHTAHDETPSWRPFQLAFVLLNVPALTDPASPDRDIVDLLFFPTGGGKTEAYLGLAAFTFAIRRLHKVIGTGADARSGEGGVAVLMRYTLRLLTAQQFQRAAALVCAAEVLRRDDPVTWGNEPFRIGLWVGGAVSPNWYQAAAEQISAARDAPSTARTGVLQTLACPWCGTALAAHRDLRPDDDRHRVLLYCSAGEGPDPCPFSAVRSPGEGLPILTVDEEIYRLLPALVIATVDKLAQLPWHGYAGMLFGRVSRRCPRHGFQHFDLTERAGCTPRHNATRSGLPAVVSHGRALRGGGRRTVPVAGWRCSSRAEDRGVHRDDEACRRAGAGDLRTRPGDLSAAGAGRLGHVLLPSGVRFGNVAGAAIYGYLRARGPAEVGGDPARGNPAVAALEASVSAEQVADIFVRINSEGVALSYADFILTLMSVFWEKGRAELEDFARRCTVPSVSGPSPFNWHVKPLPDQLLRVSVALAFRRARLSAVYLALRGRDLDSGEPDPAHRDEQFAKLEEAQQHVLNLTNWHEYLSCLERAGFRGAKMISSENAILFTSAMWLFGRVECKVSLNPLREVIARWFFMAQLTSRYSGTFESQADRDFSRVRGLAAGDAVYQEDPVAARSRCDREEGDRAASRCACEVVDHLGQAGADNQHGVVGVLAAFVQPEQHRDADIDDRTPGGQARRDGSRHPPTTALADVIRPYMVARKGSWPRSARSLPATSSLSCLSFSTISREVAISAASAISSG
jgi:hypothetical protein